MLEICAGRRTREKNIMAIGVATVALNLDKGGLPLNVHSKHLAGESSARLSSIGESNHIVNRAHWQCAKAGGVDSRWK